MKACLDIDHLLLTLDLDLLYIVRYLNFLVNNLRRNPPDVGVTSGQKPCTKIIYIVL